MTSAQVKKGREPDSGSDSASLENTSKTSSDKPAGTDAPASADPAAQKSDSASVMEDTGKISPGDALHELIHGKGDTGRIPGPGRMPTSPLGRSSGASAEERKTAYKRWLQERSKDELIELIVGLENREPGGDHTEKVTTRLRPEDATPSQTAEGYQIPDDLVFVRLPVVRKTSVNEATPTWQIVLVPLEQNTRPIGLQIDSEISIGRTAGDTTPDLDLTPHGAKTKGVSRIHARLRPEINSLLLFDNDSSNGTFWNRIRLPAQTDRLLRDGDVLTFGRLTFLLKIVKAPNTNDARTLL